MKFPALLPILALLAARLHAAEVAPDFNRDIRPILSENCFKCHGPDEAARKGKLRLDTREGALAVRDGTAAIVPGIPAESELLKRLESDDAEEVMPPPKTHKKVSVAQREKLRQWIAAGAPWGKHWAYLPPRADPPPGVKNAAWPRNEIDRFILNRLEHEGLTPTPKADRTTWLRRVSFDLTGLPPSLAEVDAFLADQSPDACARVVDRLLASPHFGERMAMDWLDAARFADTNGYFRDNARQVWPWRDWVINAFNRNLPYDRFTIEQLAGDLLPDATIEQKIATGFSRNHMVTGESGIIDEEYRVEYVADRMETMSTVWLGSTIACARCHDHKYDPFSQREYYQLFSFFNNGPEKGLVTQDDPPPTLEVATDEQLARLDGLMAARQQAQAGFDQAVAPVKTALPAWEAKASAELKPVPAEGLLAACNFESNAACANDARWSGREEGSVRYEPGVLGNALAFDSMQHVELPAALPAEADAPWSLGLWMKTEGSLSCILSKIEPKGRRRGFEIIWQKKRLQINLVEEWGVKAIELLTEPAFTGNVWHHLALSYDGSRKAQGVHVYMDGAPVTAAIVRDTLAGSIANAEPWRIGRRDAGLGCYGMLDEFRLLGRAIPADEACAWARTEKLLSILATPPGKRDGKQKAQLLETYLKLHGDEAARAAQRRLAEARTAEETFRAELPKTLVMQELPAPRQAHLLKRGQYDEPGEAVQPGVPASLGALPHDAPSNRLGLARWLVSAENPLTARVEVNRLWQQCFGEGLVRTLNDFGSQGEAPTHPELLDFLAARFQQDGWDIKATLREIVLSAAYRQSSVPSAELLQRDPENRLLARGPRFRLSAEMIRDRALAAGDLLVRKIGGASVKPYQPPGLWEAVSYDGELSYQQDHGEGLWRRSMYTFWKRQSPPPALLTFDGPTRETCVVRRARTNTPLQALVLLNDQTYVEAARAVAAAVMSEADGDARLRMLFRRVLSRAPADGELATLRRLADSQRKRFRDDEAAARELISLGESSAGREGAAPEVAALTVVAHALMNTDEFVTLR